MSILQAVTVFVLLFPATASADAPPLPKPDPSLQSRIQFWIRVYSEYSSSEGIIHDAKYPEIIYEKVDFKPETGDHTLTPKVREHRIQQKIRKLKDFYTQALLKIHKGQHYPERLSDADKRLFDIYLGVQDPHKFFNAAPGKRVRFQLGLKDRFLQGLYYSGKYLAAMERIFRNHGVPVEITRLPFVESSFNLNARSKVGASGIWQFMRSTGKLYLKIDSVLDERNDPIRATEAAAELLRQNFEALGSWPFAVTAYNHGRKGMVRAARKLGTDSLTEIIDNYRARSFGFASSNFYCEFLAALEVERNAEKYFRKVERQPPIEFSEFVMGDYMDIRDLSTYTRIPLDVLTEFNPSLTENVVKGKHYVPTQFPLRIPVSMREAFLGRYVQIPASKKHSAQKRALF